MFKSMLLTYEKLPAPGSKIGLMDRGLIREGMWADIVIFDLKKLGIEQQIDFHMNILRE